MIQSDLQKFAKCFSADEESSFLSNETLRLTAVLNTSYYFTLSRVLGVQSTN
jgi:hypothetical protein